MVPIYTIGHSTNALTHFLRLLDDFRIGNVIDVRSVPYSRIAPHFNRERLARELKVSRKRYAHWPKEFGARYEDPAMLDENGRVDYKRVRSTSAFQHGVQRLKAGAASGYRIALMCSESDPFDCHRFVMISYQLVKEGLEVQHILKDGTSVGNDVLERKLIKKYYSKLPHNTFFDGDVSVVEQLEEAYRLRNIDIAYSLNQEPQTLNAE